MRSVGPARVRVRVRVKVPGGVRAAGATFQRQGQHHKECQEDTVTTALERRQGEDRRALSATWHLGLYPMGDAEPLRGTWWLIWAAGWRTSPRQTALESGRPLRQLLQNPVRNDETCTQAASGLVMDRSKFLWEGDDFFLKSLGNAGLPHWSDICSVLSLGGCLRMLVHLLYFSPL